MGHIRSNGILPGLTGAVLLFASAIAPPVSAQDGVVVFGGDATYPPFEWLEDGTPRGFHIDLERRLAGLSEVTPRWKLGDWPEIVRALEDGSVDVVPMFRSAAREERFRFVGPISYMSHSIYRRPDSDEILSVEDFAGLRIALEELSYAHQTLPDLQPDAILVPRANTLAALEALVEGEADYALLAMPAAAHLIRSHQFDIRRTGPPLWSREYAFAVRRDRTDLASWLANSFRRLVVSGAYDEVYAHWQSQLEPYEDANTASSRSWLVWLFGIGLSAAILWVILLRRRLARREAAGGAPDVAMSPADTRLVGDFLATGGRCIHAHYQPQLDLRSGRIVSVEALARWNHPEHGAVPPGRFVRLLEQAGHIAILTERMIGEAARTAAVLRQAGYACPVSVNVSAQDLLTADVEEMITGAFATHGAGELHLELTETVIAADPERIAAVLARLHARGITCALDDFGTGYSSLSNLSDFPVSEVKIDRQFVSSMVESDRHRAIVRSTIAMARELGLVTVAEGAEDAATLHALAEEGCDRVQGFVISKPLPESELPDILGRRFAIGPPPRARDVNK